MKISREWLQTFFDTPLPDVHEISRALTFHAFEIESVENDVLDVKVTPNRGHDALSHRGIAKELSVILNIPLKADPLRTPLPEFTGGPVDMNIEDTERVPVAAAAYVRGVKIGPSPDWLKNRLEAVGQRSINNVVDATNYVMFDIGMPTHAFDAETFKDGERINYGIRRSKKGEHLTLLGDKFVELTGDEAVIMNASKAAVDIGGVKGGALAELSDASTELLLSASKFHPVHTRKAAQRFNQRTEAAKRFENEMPDDLALYGIQAVAELVRDVAGGEIVGYGIKRAHSAELPKISVSLSEINEALGTVFSETQVEDVFRKLEFAYEKREGSYFVTPTFERLDIVIPEDLIEEVGRIVGYDKVIAAELSAFPKQPEVNQLFAASERVREDLIAKGYSEVYTSVFSEKGERQVLNKVGGGKSYLRSNLTDGLTEALERNIHNKDLLGLTEVKLFEIGTIWPKAGAEEIVVGVIGEKEKPHEKPLSTYVQEISLYDTFLSSRTERYRSFSRYPSITRDVAMWIPTDIKPEAIESMIRSHAGELLIRIDLFDTFEKGGKTSFAFRLVFQSFDKTLTDDDANHRMESVYKALKAEGYDIR